MERVPLRKVTGRSSDNVGRSEVEEEIGAGDESLGLSVDCGSAGGRRGRR